MKLTTVPQRLELIEPTNPLLNAVAEAVAPEQITTPFIQGVADRMLELAAGKGLSKNDSRQMVGLAAVQLGVAKRIISIDIAADGSLKKQVLTIVINPVITKKSSRTTPGREGCWSCGNICGNVERAVDVTVQGLDRSGESIALRLTGFVARIAQHEIDHLDGIRFPDRIPADEPERLHLVEPAEFDDYRTHWETWQKLCPRGTWESLKTGAMVKK